MNIFSSEAATNVWAACSAGRTVYKNQMDKTSNIKVRSLKYALETNFPSYHTFGNDLNSIVENLCDSKRFIDECESLGLEPKVAAQHVVFAGKTAYNNVRDMGVKATFGSQVREFNKPLYVEVI